MTRRYDKDSVNNDDDDAFFNGQDGLDADFIEEQWQFVSSSDDDDDDDDDLTDFKPGAGTNWYLPDNDDDELEDNPADYYAADDEGNLTYAADGDATQTDPDEENEYDDEIVDE